MSEPIVFIPLTRGQVAVVDFADFEKVRGFRWHAYQKRLGGKVYAARNATLPSGRRTIRAMHKDILPESKLLDHRDGDGLNNRRSNLRTATCLQNLQASKDKRNGASSRFRGVSWQVKRSAWRAKITVNGQEIFLGRFSSEEDAARAYDTAARKHFGEFASPNFL